MYLPYDKIPKRSASTEPQTCLFSVDTEELIRIAKGYNNGSLEVYARAPRLRLSFLKDLQERGLVAVMHISVEENASDILTKLIEKLRLEKLGILLSLAKPKEKKVNESKLSLYTTKRDRQATASKMLKICTLRVISKLG